MVRTFEELRGLHNQLRRLLDCGQVFSLSGELGLLNRKQLDRLDRSLSDSETSGQDATIWLEDDSLPQSYRQAAKLWVGGDRVSALNRLARSSETRRLTGHAIGVLGLHLMLLLGAVYIGFVTLCVYLLPTLESIQRESFVEPGWYLRCLLAIRKFMPIWVVAVPLVAAILAWYGTYRFLHRQRGRSAIDISFALSHFLGKTQVTGLLPLASTGAVILSATAVLLLAGLTVAAIVETLLVALEGF